MKEMQEMPDESDAIEDRDFHVASFVILRASVFPNLVSPGLGRDEDVVLNVLPLRGDFLKRAVDVATLAVASA